MRHKSLKIISIIMLTMFFTSCVSEDPPPPKIIPRDIALAFNYIDGILDDDIEIQNVNDFTWSEVTIKLEIKRLGTWYKGPIIRKFPTIHPDQKILFSNIWESTDGVQGHMIHIIVQCKEGLYDRAFENQIQGSYNPFLSKNTYNWVEITFVK